MTQPTTQQLTPAEIRLAQYGQRASTWTTATYNDGTEKALHEIALGLKTEVDRLRAETVALPANWECSHGPADDEPFCAEAEDDTHVCRTIRVDKRDAADFAALVASVHHHQRSAEHIAAKRDLAEQVLGEWESGRLPADDALRMIRSALAVGDVKTREQLRAAPASA